MSQPYRPDPRIPNPNPQVSHPPMVGPNGNMVPVNAGRDAYGENRERDWAGNEGERQANAYENKNLQRANMRYWVTAIVYFILGVLEVIMGLRFVFRLLGASQGNSFIIILYSLSHTFVAPFNGIFNDQAIGNVSVFELSTLVAMLIYALVAWGLVALGRVIFSPTYNTQQR